MTLKMTVAEPAPLPDPIVPLEKWGKDHWSTFAYIETRIVDRRGIPNKEHMRCDRDLHPQFGHRGTTGKKYPTRLNDGTEQADHDDWSCLDDAEAVGLIENKGTGFNRVYVLTEEGKRCAAALRRHKGDGGNFGYFRWEPGKE